MSIGMEELGIDLREWAEAREEFKAICGCFSDEMDPPQPFKTQLEQYKDLRESGRSKAARELLGSLIESCPNVHQMRLLYEKRQYDCRDELRDKLFVEKWSSLCLAVVDKAETFEDMLFLRQNTPHESEVESLIHQKLIEIAPQHFQRATTFEEAWLVVPFLRQGKGFKIKRNRVEVLNKLVGLCIDTGHLRELRRDGVPGERLETAFLKLLDITSTSWDMRHLSYATYCDSDLEDEENFFDASSSVRISPKMRSDMWDKWIRLSTEELLRAKTPEELCIVFRHALYPSAVRREALDKACESCTTFEQASDLLHHSHHQCSDDGYSEIAITFKKTLGLCTLEEAHRLYEYMPTSPEYDGPIKDKIAQLENAKVSKR